MIHITITIAQHSWVQELGVSCKITTSCFQVFIYIYIYIYIYFDLLFFYFVCYWIIYLLIYLSAWLFFICSFVYWFICRWSTFLIISAIQNERPFTAKVMVGLHIWSFKCHSFGFSILRNIYRVIPTHHYNFGNTYACSGSWKQDLQNYSVCKTNIQLVQVATTGHASWSVLR